MKVEEKKFALGCVQFVHDCVVVESARTNLCRQKQGLIFSKK